MAYKSFDEMISALRAGQAAGMDCTIMLEPEAAGYLAGILEEYRNLLRADIEAKARKAAGVQ